MQINLSISRFILSLLVILVALSPLGRIGWIGRKAPAIKWVTGIVLAALFLWVHTLMRRKG